MLDIRMYEVRGFDMAIKAMRNPLNSWGKSDSTFNPWGESEMGEKDHELAMKLVRSGSDHGKFLRMIQVWVEINAPLYWWKEFDTYKVGTVANSCSTMHTLHKRDLELNDFSLNGASKDARTVLEHTLQLLNCYRREFVETGSKDAWRTLIQLLPSGFMQMRTVNMNYAVLRNIYHARKGHKLSEWSQFLEWVETLPYSEFITEE